LNRWLPLYASMMPWYAVPAVNRCLMQANDFSFLPVIAAPPLIVGSVSVCCRVVDRPS
jgi:hypothetical protein